MKTYALALKRLKERYDHINKHLKSLSLDFRIIDAVDGRKLSQEELESYGKSK